MEIKFKKSSSIAQQPTMASSGSPGSGLSFYSTSFSRDV